VDSEVVQSLIRYSSRCMNVLPSIIHSSKDRGAPIWVSVPFTVDRRVSPSRGLVTVSDTASQRLETKQQGESLIDWSRLMSIDRAAIGSDEEYSKCITALSRHLNIDRVSYSSYKSTRASRLLFW
jgi:hypothetical protein